MAERLRMPAQTWKMRALGVVGALTFLVPFIPAPSAYAATIDITSYGANGSDSSDDMAAIQSAIDAAASGDTIYFPPGTYYVSGSIQAKSGIKLLGHDRDDSIVKYSGTTDGAILSLNNTTDVEVAGLTIDGNSNTHVTAGIWGEPGGGHDIHDNRFKDLTKSDGFAPFGILMSNSPNVKITDNDFINMGTGSMWGAAMRVGWGSDAPDIERNTIANTGRGGIFVNDGVDGAVIRDNVVTGSGLFNEGLSIELHTDVNHSIVEDNQVDHWLSVVRSEYNAIRRNTIHTTDNTVKGIGLEIMSNHSVTSDNLVDGGQQVGMQQSPGTGYQLWNYNTVQNIVMWGMQLQGEGTGETEQYQYFYKNTLEDGPIGNPAAAYPGYDGNAVRIHGNTQNVTFDSNRILNNGRKAIEITTASGTDRLSFINNTITGNGGPSIDQYPSSAADLEWFGNTVSGNGTDTQLTSRGFSDPKPTANFTTPLSVQLGQSVTFTNTSTDNGSIVENLWDFGEGVPVTTVSPTYTYQKAGTYRVTLVVWDNTGRANLKEQTINVYAGPPDTTAPSAPANLTAPSKSNVTVDLSWSASTDNVGVVGYDVYKNGTPAGSTTGANATAFTVTGLTPSTSYSFTVKARDAAGNVSAASSALGVTTDAGDTQPPTAPGNLAVTAKTDTSVSLAWSASTDNVGVTGYDVYAGSSLAGSTTGAGATAVTLNGLTPSTAYSFTVKARDASNNVSAASGAVTVTTDPLADWVPCAGENNLCSFTGTHEVRYGANGSYVYGTYTNSVMCSNNGFGTDPAVGYYKTCDVNMASEGGNGGQGGDTTAPSAPGNLTSPSQTADTISLSWSASTDNVGVAGYDVYRGGTLAGSTTGANATTFTATGLSQSTTYSFTVKARDAAGNVSAASAALSATTAAQQGGGGPSPTGTIVREYWTNISGPTVSSIPLGTTPTGTSVLTSFEAPTNWGDHYGTRIRGYIVPTVTGTYRFSIAGDNNCQLWLSTDDSAANKTMIGEVVDWTYEKNWTQNSSQQSGSITLTAGQRYYVEALQKEESGDDHLAVAWMVPGSTSYAVIDGAHLAPLS
ncbi:fibronectin type III domain-containing protein [Cohnella zeiphila]|uniref:Fibronectin type III domain-containing protein n=1 Tax=Cohnella zeiphila TaxID=2761120 RepID=A0A7X0SMY4_9BACL|nr:fibronectin type III domain-containing protein [Cohnella zeiphila]MBB6732962.1 fibronectin type III domain-containing protein [Cohnella zeiphila]